MGRGYGYAKWQIALVLALVVLLSGGVAVRQFIPTPRGDADHEAVTVPATLTAAGRERERILNDMADVRHIQPRQIVVSDFSPGRPHRLAVFMPANDGSYHPR